MHSKSNMVNDVYRVFIMGVATALEKIFGQYDGILSTFIIFMGVDYITGICAAILSKTLSSKVGARGLAKKMGILCIIAITVVIENKILNTSGLRNAVLLFYISNEGISILENLCKLGIPIPNRLKSILIKMQGDDKDM